MARIEGVGRGGGLLARLAFWISRRKTGKVVAPVRIHALRTPILYGYGQMELAQERANQVPAQLKSLGQIRIALRIGCPF